MVGSRHFHASFRYSRLVIAVIVVSIRSVSDVLYKYRAYTMGLSGLPWHMKHELCNLRNQIFLFCGKPRSNPLCELFIRRVNLSCGSSFERELTTKPLSSVTAFFFFFFFFFYAVQLNAYDKELVPSECIHHQMYVRVLSFSWHRQTRDKTKTKKQTKQLGNSFYRKRRKKNLRSLCYAVIP